MKEERLSEYIRSSGVSPSVLTEDDFWMIVAVADAHGMGWEYIHTRDVDDDVASYAIEMLEAHGL